MFENLLNRIRSIFASEEYTDRSTNVVSEKDFNSLVKNLEDSLFNDCCMVCASKIIQRFFQKSMI